MSLIHEALKRVEAETANEQATAPALDYKPSMRFAAGSAKRSRLLAAVAVVICGAVAGGTTMLLVRHRGLLPGTESAVAYDSPAPVATDAKIAEAADTGTANAAPDQTAPRPTAVGTTAAAAGDVECVGGDASRFKVSAVVSGPTGQAALINGQMVSVGGMVEGARLVGINGNNVELAVGAKRVTVPLLHQKLPGAHE